MILSVIIATKSDEKTGPENGTEKTGWIDGTGNPDGIS